VLVRGELPDARSVARVHADKAVIGSEKDESAGGCHEAAPQNPAADLDFPCRLSRLEVEGFENLSGSARARRTARGSAIKRLAGFPPLIVFRIDRARFFRKHVEEAGDRAECG